MLFFSLDSRQFWFVCMMLTFITTFGSTLKVNCTSAKFSLIQRFDIGRSKFYTQPVQGNTWYAVMIWKLIVPVSKEKVLYRWFRNHASFSNSETAAPSDDFTEVMTVMVDITQNSYIQETDRDNGDMCDTSRGLCYNGARCHQHNHCRSGFCHHNGTCQSKTFDLSKKMERVYNLCRR